MSKVTLLFVTGVGGARADFVAGWLGTLPGFVNSRWLIDPTTGVSYGQMGNFRGVDSGADIHELLQEQNVLLDPEADFTWAVAVHGWGITLEQFKMLIFLGAVKFLSIDISKADHKKVKWEFFVKTYLSHRRQLESIQGYSEQWVVDSMMEKSKDITDQDRVKTLKYLMSVHTPTTKYISLNDSVPATQLDYVELFAPGGSRYLCKQLQIATSDRHHQYWDAMLSFSDSPESIEVWGHTWNRADLS